MSHHLKRITQCLLALFASVVSMDSAFALDETNGEKPTAAHLWGRQLIAQSPSPAHAGSTSKPGQVQAGTSSAGAAPPAHSASVVVNGKELFKIYGESERSTDKRLRLISAAIGKLVDDPKFHPSSLTVRNGTNSSDIVLGDKPLFAITQEDALGEGVALPLVADKWLSSIKTTIESERYRRNLSDAIDQVKFGTVKSNLLYFLGNPVSLRIGISILGLLILSVISYSIRKSIPKYFHESNKRYTIGKIAEFCSYFVCLIFLSIVFSDTLGSLAVILGAATAGIALALKDLIVSIAGWVAITFGDTYRVGDRVQVGGIKGDVIDVGLVRTTLMELGEWVQGDQYTGRIVRVSNGEIFSAPMYNYSRDLPFLWDEVIIKVNSESDPESARHLIQKVCDEVTGDFTTEAKLAWERLKEKYLVEDERIDPMVTMIVADNKFEFTARYPVDFRQRRIVRDKMFSGIVRAFAETSGAVELA
ncbi:MAG: mechanosensitive ion channel [Candidatus Melainabacteria bacterium]|nr:mechanosensitive ion channel [Candidatus Melainabacteria bacterium]